jgi:hypothetical protein
MAFNYKDPRWQKRRLEIMERDGFQCVACGSKTNELHVHHKRYKGQPWQAKDDDMQTLCTACHKALGPHPKAGIWYGSGDCISIDHCPSCKRNEWDVSGGSVCCIAEQCNGFQCDDLVKRTSVFRLNFLTFQWWGSKLPAPSPKPVKKKKVKQAAPLERGSHIAGRLWDTQLWTEAADNVGGLVSDFAQMASAVKTYETFEEGNEILHVVVEFEDGRNGHCSPHAFLSRPEIKKQLIPALFDLRGQILTLEMIIKTTEEHNV